MGATGEAFFTLVSVYKYLKILDLGDSTFETLPTSIGKVKHLRYLNLSGNMKIKRLPGSICKLQNLQMLFLGGCTNLETLPKRLGNLISLRDFDMTTKQSVLPENAISNLSSLEHLSIEFCNNVESLFSGIKLPFLKALYVSSGNRLKSMRLESKHFPALEILAVRNCEKLELSNDQEDQNFNLRLKTIFFYSLPQLVTLSHWLQGSKHFNILGTNRVLQSCNLEVLPDWLPALTSLKLLFIKDCPKLRSLPDGIHCLTALEHLKIEDCPELCNKYKPQVGENWNQISHIKQIRIGEQNIWKKS